MIATLLLAVGVALAGPWRGVLDLAGGSLRFGIELEGRDTSLRDRREGVARAAVAEPATQ